MSKRIARSLLLLLLIAALLHTPADAADILHRLTHNDQYALVLGTLTSAYPGGGVLAVSRTISGKQLWAPIRLAIPRDPNLRLHEGDLVLASIDRKGSAFSVKWGIFRVSSLNPASLRILEPRLAPGDRAALEHYVHTGGRENDFFFVSRSAFVRYADGTFRQIHPQPRNKKARHSLLICTDRDFYTLALSSTVGIGLYPIYQDKVDQPPVLYRWRTDRGEFLAWEAPTYIVRHLGTEVVLKTPEMLYWTPLAKGGSARNGMAHITLTVESAATGKSLGRYMLQVECREGAARVRQ